MYLVLSPILYLFTFVSGSVTTEYYKKLILERSAEAQNYELPKRNTQFEAGFAADEKNDFGTYDFIIIGAGSAGSVLATRLTEVDEWSVLLLEAGGEEDDFSNIPAMTMHLQFSDMNWGYYTTSQTNSCLAMRDRKCIVPRGKVIGGSSAINAQFYVRGNPKDYDKWAQLGNEGWSYKDVLPYFIKSENSQIDGDLNYHGKGGLWNVEYPQPVTELFNIFVNGSKEINAPVLDYNGQNQLGSAQAQFSIKQGRRQSTGTAFLDDARKRANLKVVTNALVTRIIIDENKLAQGVEFVTKDQKFFANATKEVILSGGSINSPQLLMLSGIGPGDHLKELGIDVIEDLPVGKNLLEHPLLPLIFHTNFTLPSHSVEESIEEYLRGLGPLTLPCNAPGIGFANPDNDVPTVEYVFFQPTSIGGMISPSSGRVYNYDDGPLINFFANLNAQSDITIGLILLHEKSTGQVTLQSNNPLDFPNIDLNMFAEQNDIDVLTEGIEFVLNLSKSEAFRKINATLVDYPICKEFGKYSKQFWKCLIRHMTATLYHPCGTTAMGSVVDTNLKVKGIKGLRVVDAGVFPSTVSGHTSAPVVMVAEKIADNIKNEHKLKRTVSHTNLKMNGIKGVRLWMQEYFHQLFRDTQVRQWRWLQSLKKSLIV